LFRIANALIVDPRPFVEGHFRPLLPHTPNNGFPSGYGLMSADVVVGILFLSRRWVVPFVVLAVLIDWARVGVGIQHVIDIVGGCAVAGLAGMLALAIGPVISALLLPAIPPRWTAEGLRIRTRHRLT